MAALSSRQKETSWRTISGFNHIRQFAFAPSGTLAGCPIGNPVGRGLGFMGGTKTPLNRHNCGSSYLTPELTGLAGTLQGYDTVSMAKNAEGLCN
jgi:hypothetical protein